MQQFQIVDLVLFLCLIGLVHDVVYLLITSVRLKLAFSEKHLNGINISTFSDQNEK